MIDGNNNMSDKYDLTSDEKCLAKQFIRMGIKNSDEQEIAHSILSKLIVRKVYVDKLSNEEKAMYDDLLERFEMFERTYYNDNGDR